MKASKFAVLLFLLVLIGHSGFAQRPAPDEYAIRIQKAVDEIKLDGVLDEATWKEADVAKDFYQTFPYDTSYSETQTEVRLTYDNKFLYVAAICWDTTPGNYVVQSLKRDFSYPVSDAFAVFIDPFRDKTNGFSFAVNPMGAQREGLVQDGGGFGVTTAWDNKWFSRVERYDDKWIVEMAIPFKTIRYKKGETEWLINFSRNNLKGNEGTSWVPVPRAYNIATLAFTGKMVWDAPPPKAGVNIALIPYGLGGWSADYEGGEKSKFKYNFGGDAKVALTSSLNLDLTGNPDFSQVDVDVQVTNLDRFQLFFPERRFFFIENSDLFANFGFTRIRPFFSRRIGLANGQPIPILGGARLSGKVNQNWRIGFMNMQTAADSANDIRSQNYMVAAAQRRILKRSNLAAIVVNRVGFDRFQPDFEDYNTTVGADFNILSNNNKIRGKIFYHHTFDGSDNVERKSANAAWLMYQDQNISVMYNHEFVDTGYNAEVGFVPRTGYFRLEPMAWYRFYPKKGLVNNHGPGVYLSQYWALNGGTFTDSRARVEYQATFQNRIYIQGNVQHDYIYLTFPFDPTRTGGPELPENTGYQWVTGAINFRSDFRKRLSYNAYASYGGWYSGRKLTYGGAIQYRAQPWGSFPVTFERNEIWMPEPYATAHLMLIGPRLEFSFTKNIFLTTFLQYNTQIDNFNINARFQWRFKPMSDLFVVLTQNYLPGNFNIKNQAVVIKLNYWFQI